MVLKKKSLFYNPRHWYNGLNQSIPIRFKMKIVWDCLISVHFICIKQITLKSTINFPLTTAITLKITGKAYCSWQEGDNDSAMNTGQEYYLNEKFSFQADGNGLFLFSSD